MALVKPIINEIAAFDATQGATITFMASGGDQVTGNTIKVALNDGSSPETVVYEHTEITYELSNRIPANVLQNGQYYRVAIKTQDILGNESPWSNSQPFYCYKTPSVSLNITENQVVKTSSLQIILSYTQAQNEKVDYALIEVFDDNNILIGSSDNLYNSNYPPLSFIYDIFGLENHKKYYTQGTVTTINGTVVKTNKVSFYTNFDTIIDENTLTATLDACNGYVNLRSSEIFKIGGTSNPTPLSYLMNNTVGDVRNACTLLDLPELSHWAKWDKMFTVPTDFLLRVWFYPASQPYELIRLCNRDGSSYMKITFMRDSTTDYICIRTDNGGVKDVPLNMLCNGNTKVFLWVKVIGNTWEVRCQIMSVTPTVFEWNSDENNIPYNTTMDLTWISENFETYTPSADNFVAMSDEFTTVIVGNGAYDHLNITTDTSISYTNTKPTDWQDDYLLNIGFNGNIANNSPNYTKLVLKRKDDTLLNWMNLSTVDITNYNVIYYINFDDSFIPTGVKQEYALVVYVDDVPSEFHTVEITPSWGRYFLSDKNNKFPLNYAVIYSGGVQNIQNGVFMPIGATYPIIVQNGEGNYKSGSVQFKVLGYQYELDKRLDRVSIKKQADDILKFLTNGKAKCLTDFNGNIFILRVINSPQISYDANWGNGIITISFDWVEQGKYNDYDSMLELGLFDYVTTE